MGKETSGRTVRPLVREDLSWLLPLDAGSFAEAWTEDTWGDELEGRLSHYIALEEMGVPVAFGGFWLVAGEAQVMRLAVDPRRREKAGAGPGGSHGGGSPEAGGRGNDPGGPGGEYPGPADL